MDCSARLRRHPVSNHKGAPPETVTTGSSEAGAPLTSGQYPPGYGVIAHSRQQAVDVRRPWHLGHPCKRSFMGVLFICENQLPTEEASRPWQPRRSDGIAKYNRLSEVKRDPGAYTMFASTLLGHSETGQRVAGPLQCARSKGSRLTPTSSLVVPPNNACLQGAWP